VLLAYHAKSFSEEDAMPHQSRVTLALADAQDRLSIYALRHQVYAHELGQHRENGDGVLTDILDHVNTYLVAKRDQAVVACRHHAAEPTRVFGRQASHGPISRSSSTVAYEQVRLLTIVESDRRTMLATLPATARCDTWSLRRPGRWWPWVAEKSSVCMSEPAFGAMACAYKRAR
jgi:hypothetical protein